MRYYEQDDNRRGKRAGAIAAAGYVVLLIVLFMAVSFTVDYEQPTDGIIVDFGTGDDGSGATEAAVAQRRDPDPVRTQPQEEIATQDNTDAPAVRPQAVQDPRPSETQQEENPQVNPRGLFPGVGANPASQSQGSTGNAGNRGHEGGEESTADAAGSGNEGAEVNLPDRRVEGRLPLPRYDENLEGRIIVDIVVNDRGTVTRASVRMQGTTILNQTLQKEATDAALKSKFSNATQAEQFGSITYVFKLR